MKNLRISSIPIGGRFIHLDKVGKNEPVERKNADIAVTMARLFNEEKGNFSLEKVDKSFSVRYVVLFALFFFAIGFTSCDESDNNVLIDDLVSLTEDEKTNLMFMREEEKLARDAYLYFHDKYGMNIFKNIASSEQTHMDAVLTIMEKYGIEDPASSELGIFSNVTLQQLYDDLIAQGDVSLAGALTVGATIEDVDIRDLDNAIEATSKTDLIEMYEKLECGSRNHMRAFISQLDAQGETYTPQFIAQEQFDEIINGEHDHCGK